MGKLNLIGRPGVPCYQQEAPFSSKIYDDDEENSRLLTLVRTVCPVYFHNRKDDSNVPYTEVCCGTDQITELASQFAQIEQLLGRCPACATNVLAIYCHTTCEPNMAEWMDAVEGNNNLRGYWSLVL